jgi:hypothetical protein
LRCAQKKVAGLHAVAVFFFDFNQNWNVGHEVFKSVTKKRSVFWDIILRSRLTFTGLQGVVSQKIEIFQYWNALKNLVILSNIKFDANPFIGFWADIS